jgi:hypothetical protein
VKLREPGWEPTSEAASVSGINWHPLRCVHMDRGGLAPRTVQTFTGQM